MQLAFFKWLKSKHNTRKFCLKSKHNTRKFCLKLSVDLTIKNSPICDFTDLCADAKHFINFQSKALKVRSENVKLYMGSNLNCVNWKNIFILCVDIYKEYMQCLPRSEIKCIDYGK